MNTAKVTNTAMLERLRETARLSIRKKGPACSICLLPETIRGVIRQLRDEGLPFPAITVALKGEGHPVNDYSLARHYRQHER